MRTLLCDGPILLAWLGGLRCEPPTEAEMALFAGLVRPLRRRLLLERRLGRGRLFASGISAALEALGRPALLVTASGTVALANQAGLAWLDLSPASARFSIREAIAGAPSELDVTPVAARGVPDHFLLVRRAQLDLEARLAQAACAWNLTPRQTEVLRRLALGDANKDVAEYFGMSLRTVEQHVTDLLVKAGVDSRLRLLARLWQPS